ncbi:hypothetical protein TrCOL_g3858 [Triparma columacea]|uniref:Uncharacterized protein n=1 Tax=Triparma columacea TaxID=722753 RepID=A0A9W7LA97_9STRA|nr:hypothetical protein TrCOL_g3858 [Triparma columacea]
MGASSEKKRALARANARKFYLPIFLLVEFLFLLLTSSSPTFLSTPYLIRSLSITSVLYHCYTSILTAKEDAVSTGMDKSKKSSFQSTSSSSTPPQPGSRHIDLFALFSLLKVLGGAFAPLHTFGYLPPLVYWLYQGYSIYSTMRGVMGGGGVPGGGGGGEGGGREVDEQTKRRREDRAKKRRTKTVR